VAWYVVVARLVSRDSGRWMCRSPTAMTARD
jgi:hypothetical protein